MNEAVEENRDEISCGERLAKKRSEKELSVNQVAREIKIEPHVIEMIENNDFVEHAVFSGNMYGTSKKAIQDVLENG